MTGETLLELLVRYESDGLYSGYTWIGDLARRTGASRQAVGPRLRRLVAAGLAERAAEAPLPSWRPTERGREVDATLRRITVRRGGRFEPRVHAGITHRESHALR